MLKKLSLIAFIALSFSSTATHIKIEQWGLFELTFQSKQKGAFDDNISLTAVFIHQNDSVKINGFYNGDGSYKVRFMPHKQGIWKYQTFSNDKKFAKSGGFECIASTGNNHGPVAVKDTFYFSYADGTLFHPIGTTAYRIMETDSENQEKTFAALKNSPFNKVRFKIIGPVVGGKDSKIYPFETENNQVNFNKINPQYFATFEKGIEKLLELGIQADLIFMHPYDINTVNMNLMTREQVFNYLDYIIARFSAYRNVWWTTNEFDLLTNFSMELWDEIFSYLQKNDPYNHLRSHHNAAIWYDHTKPWITHASIQGEAWWLGKPTRTKIQKPVIFDEFCYEGYGYDRTVSLNGDVITHRFWLMTVNGTFATHGEAIINPSLGFSFFDKGGEFIGLSHQQLHTLKKVIEEAPEPIRPLLVFDWRLDNIFASAGNNYHIYYFGEYQNKFWKFSEIPEGISFNVEIIDTRTGKTTKLDQLIKKEDIIELPGKPYQAMVLKKNN